MIVEMRESLCDPIAGDFDSVLILFVDICSLYCYNIRGEDLIKEGIHEKYSLGLIFGLVE